MLLATGCGAGTRSLYVARGKELFTQGAAPATCSQNADTKGFRGRTSTSRSRSRSRTVGRSTIKGVVREQIAFPQGAQMPANLVTGKDAEAVAAYVASAIGKKGGAAGGPSGTAKANARRGRHPDRPERTARLQFKDAEREAGEGDARVARTTHPCRTTSP